MGRPRKPTRELELNGAFDKNPKRKRERAKEPKPEGSIGSPPAHWCVADGDFRFQEYGRLRKIWDELISQAIPGVLFASDRMHLEIVCGLVDKYRRNLLKDAGIKTLDKMLGEIALNASARSKFTVMATPPGPAPNVDNSSRNTFQDIADEKTGSRPN